MWNLRSTPAEGSPSPQEEKGLRLRAFREVAGPDVFLATTHRGSARPSATQVELTTTSRPKHYSWGFHSQHSIHRGRPVPNVGEEVQEEEEQVGRQRKEVPGRRAADEEGEPLMRG